MANIEVREKDYTYIQHWAKDHDISPNVEYKYNPFHEPLYLP